MNKMLANELKVGILWSDRGWYMATTVRWRGVVRNVGYRTGARAERGVSV